LIKSEALLPSRYNIWTAGITLLHKLESGWQEAGYGSLSEGHQAICDLRHALFWASVCKTSLSDLKQDLPIVSDIESPQLLHRTVGAVRFILSAMKSIWLLDKLELTSAFGWFPRKIRDLSAMLLHRIAEYLEHFFTLGIPTPCLDELDRFGDFSFRIAIPVVEMGARESYTEVVGADTTRDLSPTRPTDLSLVSFATRHEAYSKLTQTSRQTPVPAQTPNTMKHQHNEL